MRLICPNCGAQYEVDDRVIPDAGRDVQCSNCGHAWYQVPPIRDAGLADELGLEAPVEDLATPSESAEPEPHDATGDAGEAEEGADTPARRELEPEVRDILREEADFETRQREREREGLETQADLGLDDAEPAAPTPPVARERLARMRGLDEDDLDAELSDETETSGPRRDLLPDIEEINSTLTAGGRQGAETAAAQDTSDAAKQGRGFSIGFLLIVLIALALVLVYTFAEPIAAQVPAVESYLADYVDFIDRMRIGADLLMQQAIQKLQGISGGQG